MSAKENLAKIPVIAVHVTALPNLEWKRRVVQYGTLAALVLVPILGIFRIDFSAGFVVLGRQIWFSDFFIVFGLWLSLACLLVMFYSTLGTAFCGWACPQNTLSAWANRITQKYLGKRAVVDWDMRGDQAHISVGKNKWGNWVLLGLKLLGAGMAVSLIPMLYIYPPTVVWHFVTFQTDPLVTGSLYWIFSVFVFVVWLNLAVMRYYVCRYMCVYRIWQFLFKTRNTMHVQYEETRSDECAKCNFCVTACPVAIDPRRTELYDSCTNCGECITACDDLHRKDKVPGLLRFRFGLREGRAADSTNLVSVAQRAQWALPVFILGVTMAGWGFWNYQPYQLSVYRSETWQGSHVQEYRVHVVHKIYSPGHVTLHVEGLPEGSYTLATHTADFESAGREDVTLRLSRKMTPGMHVFLVHAESSDGWRESFKVQHFAGSDHDQG